MTKAVFSFLCSCFVQAAFSQGKIAASISNFENNKGVCRACLFNSEDSYGKKQPQQCITVSVVNKKAEAVFTELPPGTYAMFVFHDTNSNGKMDTNFLGIPSEGYGASLNKLPFAAAPKFNNNKFNLASGTTVSLKIKLRNL